SVLPQAPPDLQGRLLEAVIRVYDEAGNVIQVHENAASRESGEPFNLVVTVRVGLVARRGRDCSPGASAWPAPAPQADFLFCASLFENGETRGPPLGPPNFQL